MTSYESPVNSEKPEQERQDTPSEGLEREEYEFKKMSAGWKALGAFEVGAVASLHKLWSVSNEDLKKIDEETGSRVGWFLSHFAKKTFQGYKAMERADVIFEEEHFENVSTAYEKMIEEASGEDRERIKKEFEEVKWSRKEKIAKEAKDKKRKNKVFSLFGDIFKTE